MRKLMGNTVAIPCVEAVLQSVFSALETQPIKTKFVVQKAVWCKIGKGENYASYG